MSVCLKWWRQGEERRRGPPPTILSPIPVPEDGKPGCQLPAAAAMADIQEWSLVAGLPACHSLPEDRERPPSSPTPTGGRGAWLLLACQNTELPDYCRYFSVDLNAVLKCPNDLSLHAFLFFFATEVGTLFPFSGRL